MADYIVVTPLVIAKTPGGDRYIYQGGSLPSDITDDHLKQLIAEKQVAEGEAAPVAAESVEDDGKPAGNASLEEWQEYARGQGATDADLEGVSRNDLRDRYV